MKMSDNFFGREGEARVGSGLIRKLSGAIRVDPQEGATQVDLDSNYG